MKMKSANTGLAILLFMAMALTACGGSGGSSATVKGIAAGGAPIAGATVTLKDALGNVKTATTATDGTFSIDVNGLTAPFILSVAGTGGPYYSYASSANSSANLTPYTTVLLQAYYGVKSTSATAVFANPVSGAPIPSSSMDALQGGLLNVIQIYLTDANVPNASSFNFFTTIFSANHTGFDRILDRTVLTGPTTFTVDNGSGSSVGAVSSTIGVSPTPASGGTSASVSFTSSTSNGSATSKSQQNVPIGGSASQQSDLDAAKSGILQMFVAMVHTAKVKGSSLQASDLDAYVDAGYLEDNQSRIAMENNIVDFFAHQVPSGATVTPSLYRLYSFTDNSSTDQKIDVTVDLQVSSGGTTVDNYLSHGDFGNDGEIYHLDNAGAWTFYGHQNHTNPHIQLQAETFRDPNTSSNSGGLLIQAQVSTDQALGVTGVDVASSSANSLPDCSSYAGSNSNTQMTQTQLSLMKDNGTYNGQDRFDLPCYPSGQYGQPSPVMIDPASAPMAGTLYGFTIKDSGGTLETNDYSLNAFTTELIHIQTINGSSAQTFASSTHASSTAGQTLTITYTVPTTFPVAYSYITAFCENQNEASTASGGGGAGGGIDISGNANQIPAGTNSGTITIPTQCDGAPPYTLGVSAWFVGTNGEITYAVQNLLDQ